jgi:hypothetical protein
MTRLTIFSPTKPQPENLIVCLQCAILENTISACKCLNTRPSLKFNPPSNILRPGANADIPRVHIAERTRGYIRIKHDLNIGHDI